ncbi:hypothetical protein ACIPY6_02840 [Streptomyces sp. NPDC090054]|uniref:hypothetical protein n=1 Tax=Streptomyces sp. NPDC090054 TaxID=3365933 RepID=UPI00381644DA
MAGPANAILRYFKFGHLPDPLRAVSAPFADLANQLVAGLPPGPELTAPTSEES